LILKSPQHTFRLPTIEQRFPQARYIYLTRDPRSVVPSTVRLWKTLSSVHGYGTPMRASLTADVLTMFRHMHERWEGTQSQVPADRLCTLKYEEFVRDPVEQLRRIYAQLDLGDFSLVEPKMREAVAGRADYRPNRHALPDDLLRDVQDACGDYARVHGYALE
jgi:hypothetical protein